MNPMEAGTSMKQYRLWCTGSDRDGWLESSEEAAQEAILTTLKEWANVHKLMDRDMATRSRRLWDELVRDGYAEVTEGRESIAFSMDVLEEN